MAGDNIGEFGVEEGVREEGISEEIGSGEKGFVLELGE